VRLLADTLQDDHDIRPQVTNKSWAGSATWTNTTGGWMFRLCLSKSGWASSGLIGYRHVLLRGLLKSLTDYKHDPIDENEFLDKWRNAVGDTFASQADLSLLSVRPLQAIVQFHSADHGQQGNYLVSSKAAITPPFEPADILPIV
jgi:hypothetical protein